jgi:hypothetical protein
LWITLGITGITPYYKSPFWNIGAESRWSHISSRHTGPVSSRCPLPASMVLLPSKPNSPRRSGPRQLRQCDRGAAAGGKTSESAAPIAAPFGRGSFSWKAKPRKAAGIRLAFAIIAVTNPGRHVDLRPAGRRAPPFRTVIPGAAPIEAEIASEKAVQKSCPRKTPPGEGGASHGNR